MSFPMTLTNPELWRKIETFEIDEGTPRLTFAARLARENGWTATFSRRVVDEYKRFVYLAMTAGHRVTLSEHVDQAWHLHMLYTDSYWKRLCGAGGVLPRTLEHTPTKGGGSEDAKFDDWYAKTKAVYGREFGERPPRDIWPESDVRFGHDLQWRRVNVADSWVVPKRAGRTVAGILTMIVIGVVLMATLLSPNVPVEVKTIAVIVGAVLVVVTLVVGTFGAAIAMTSRRGGTRKGDASGSCGGIWWLGDFGSSSGGGEGHHAGGHGHGHGHSHGHSHGDCGEHSDSCGSHGDSGGGGCSSAGGDGGGGGGGCGGGGCGGGGD